ncbi:MAG: hypothetical protein ACXWP5_09860 [Bdellovibrionota bacterium]
MKSSLWLVALISALISASALGAEIVGSVTVGPFFNCAVVNPFSIPVTVTGVQYDYTCQSYAGPAFRYFPAVACLGDCGLLPGFGNVYSGPSTLDCNVVYASWVAETVP